MALLQKSTNDSQTVTDVLTRTTNSVRKPTDALVVTDVLTAQKIKSLTIVNARALTSTKVRIDFSAPTLINDALRDPSSYNFQNISPGSIDVIPLLVTLPAGQANPTFVELDVTEHTNGATYRVSLSSNLSGVAGEVSNLVPFSYTGLGVRPTIALVLATSPTVVEVHFSEPIANNAAANEIGNYAWDKGLQTLAVKSVVGSVVTLQTTPQVAGELYTLSVSGTSSDPTFAEILGGLYVDEWARETGSSALSLTSAAGRVLPAVNTPAYAVDGSNFAGGKVPGSVRASSSRFQGSGFLPLALAGAKPWMLVVCRFAALGGGLQVAWSFGKPATTQYSLLLSADGLNFSWSHPSFNLVFASADIGVHAFEFWLDGTKANVRMDSGAIVQTAFAGGLTVDMDGGAVGASANGTLTADSKVSRIVIAASKPPEPQCAAAVAHGRALDGF